MKQYFLKKEEVQIDCNGVSLNGILSLPEAPIGLVIFAHGSGSSRHSPRNIYVADFLNQHGIATLLLDLLLTEEDELFNNRFNIRLLTMRLAAAIKWAKHYRKIHYLPIGLFGASTGAAAALQLAGSENESFMDILTVVSRGGRPDLADLDYLASVKAATLLIVGSRDYPVIAFNEYAFKHLTCEKELKIVEGATHLFEEPGTLAKVAELSCQWFKKYLHTSMQAY